MDIEKLENKFKQLPPNYQQQVVDFVDFLLSKHQKKTEYTPEDTPVTVVNEKQEEYVRLGKKAGEFPVGVRGVRRNVTLEELMKEQNYTGPGSFEDHLKRVEKIEWEESLEELLAAIK